MPKIWIEMAKAKRICCGCTGDIPKFHTVVCRAEPKLIPTGKVMVKINYCHKCGLRIIQESIKHMHSELSRLADLNVRCQIDLVPENMRLSLRYIKVSGTGRKHLLPPGAKSSFPEKALCGRSFRRFSTGKTSPIRVRGGSDICRRCLQKWEHLQGMAVS